MDGDDQLKAKKKIARLESQRRHIERRKELISQRVLWLITDDFIIEDIRKKQANPFLTTKEREELEDREASISQRVLGQ